jgi:hypothetical protein
MALGKYLNEGQNFNYLEKHVEALSDVKQISLYSIPDTKLDE